MSEVTMAHGRAVVWAGWLPLRASDSDAACARAREALVIGEAVHDPELLALTHLLLGVGQHLLDVSADSEHLEKSEQLFASLGDPRGLANVLGYRAGAYVDRGDLTTAYWLADLALTYAPRDEYGGWVGRRHNREVIYVRVAIMGLAAVAAAEGRVRRALPLEAASLALKHKWELHTGPVGSPLDRTFSSFIDSARQELDQTARAEATAEGRLMTDEQAIEYALSDCD